MAVDKIARMQNARNTSDLAQIASQLNTATTLTHTQTESVKSLPTGTLDGVVDNFETRGLSLVNLVAGSDIAAAGTVSFQSVVGAKYYDSLNETVLTGTGASMTATNASGATADMMIIPMTALGIADYTEAQMLDLVRGGYFDGLKGVENSTITTKNADESKSSHLTITPTLRSLPNGVHDRVYEADGQIWLEKRVGEYTLVADAVNLITSLANVALLYGNADPVMSDAVLGDNNLATGRTIVEGYVSEIAMGERDATASIGKCYYSDTGGLGFMFALGTTLATAQASVVGKKVHYQLATPQLINLTAEGLTEGELQSFTNGTVYLGADAFHVPSASFDVLTNTGAVIQSLVESANAQAKAIESKASKEQEDWIEPTLLNGWVNYGSPQETAGYMKDDMGFVHLKGLIKSGSAIPSTAFFVLPIGYRPLGSLNIGTVSNTAFATIAINPITGNLTIEAGSNAWFSLDGITFRAEA
jgi:hypothetical protein